MIDIENIVFNKLKTEIVALFPTATVSGAEIDIPASFPCVTIAESDNSTYEKSLDGTNVEHHARVTYTINIYSNKKDSKKSQAKSILNVVDTHMIGMKFARISCGNIPNVDKSIYRITARYQAIVEQGVVSGVSPSQTTTYQMYKK